MSSRVAPEVAGSDSRPLSSRSICSTSLGQWLWHLNWYRASVITCKGLSYGFSGIEIHTADPCDDLIHRFGYRASRGMLVLAGRPDGRLFSLTRTEVAGIMGIKQLRFVESLNEGTEVITTGANPFHEQTLVHAHIALPQSSAAKRIISTRTAATPTM